MLGSASAGSLKHRTHVSQIKSKCHSAALPDCLGLSCVVLDTAKHAKGYSAVGYVWYTVCSCGVSSVAHWELQFHPHSCMHRLEA